MADRLQFKEKLAGVLALAEDQNGKITVDEVEKYFEEDGLSQEQMNLVCDYLLSMKMAVIGYKQAGGRVSAFQRFYQVCRTCTGRLSDPERIRWHRLLCTSKDGKAGTRYLLPSVQ